MPTPPPPPKPLALLTPDQAAALIADLPGCKLIRGGRALQLALEADPKRLYLPLMLLTDAFLVGLEHGEENTLVQLKNRCVTVILWTSGGLSVADIQAVRMLAEKWSRTAAPLPPPFGTDLVE